MRFIPTKIHGVMDYLLFALLIASPWLFGFAAGGAETIIPVVVGAVGILYSLFTDYEVAASRQISMRTHLTLDFIAGLFLAVSPWLFGFSEFVWVPHLVLGIAEMGASLFTSRIPEYCPEGAPCYKYA